MNLKVLPLALILAVATFAACSNDDDDNNAVNSTDRDYVTKAAMSNYAEISAARLADSMYDLDPSSHDADINAFANMMIMHHQIAQDSLQTNVAQPLGLNAPDSLDAAHVQMAAMLRTLSGRAFDSAYIHGQVTDHQATIDLFQTEAASGNNNTVKAYEAQYIDVIQMHKAMSDTLAAKY